MRRYDFFDLWLGFCCLYLIGLLAVFAYGLHEYPPDLFW